MLAPVPLRRWAIVASSRGAPLIEGAGKPLQVPRHEIDLQVQARAGFERGQRGHRERVRNEVHVEARAVDAVDGQAHAVHGDRALGGDEARQLVGRFDFEEPAALRIVRDRGEPRHGSDAVDVAGHQVPSQPVGKAQRHLDVDVTHAVEAGRAAQRLRGHVEIQRGAVDLDDREAAAVEGDAVADGDIGDPVETDVDRDPQPVGLGLHRRDASPRLHDSGKHHSSFRTTRASTRRSSPTRATSRMARATRSESCARPFLNSAMPRAGSPSRQGAR